jgi:Holliday junction DNA helicase RuvB
MEKKPSMSPEQFSDFVGQNRVKARLELAVAAAKQRNEALGHVLLIGAPGSGKATMARITASTMNVGFKGTTGSEIKHADDLAGIVTKLAVRDVLFIDDLHLLPAALAEHLYPALNEFKLFLPLDQGGYTRTFRVRVPVFTLIGAVPNREQLPPNLTANFSIVESMED